MNKLNLKLARTVIVSAACPYCGAPNTSPVKVRSLRHIPEVWYCYGDDRTAGCGRAFAIQLKITVEPVVRKIEGQEAYSLKTAENE